MNRSLGEIADGCHRHRELIFWLPIGLLSLFYLLVFPTSTTPTVAQLDYKLVENATTTNTHGDPCNILRYVAGELSEDGSFAPVSTFRWAQFLSGNNHDTGDHIRNFTRILANSPMKAFFFETKGVTHADSHDQPFEFVLVESSYLYQFADANQDQDTFRGRFQQCKDESQDVACSFSSLGGDSVLITPMQIDTTNNNVYGHLAAFVRRAPADQVVTFWKSVMEAYLARLKSEDPDPVWLSTDGTGVAWLHVRLDPRPKYYDYKPYAEGGGGG